MVKEKKQSDKNGPPLSKTDKAILELIAKRGFQTPEELKEKVLQEHHSKYIWQLMRKLVLRGFVHVVKSDCGAILGWRINARRKEGQEILFGTGSQLAPKIVSYSSSFYHDLILRKIEDKLMEAPAISNWTPEHLLKAQIMEKFSFQTPEARRRNLIFVPDALLELKVAGQTVKAALELELTRKSRRILFEKLEKYVISQDYQFAFYIVEGRELINELKRVYDTVMSKSLHVKVAKSWNGIYFAELDEVQKKGIHAKFEGRKNSMTLSEIT